MKSTSTHNNEVDFSLTLDNNTIIDLKVPTSLLPLATKQKDAFLASQSAPEDENTPLLPVELATGFINHMAQSSNFSPQHDQLIQILSTHVETTLLAGTNIHALAASELHGKESRQRNLIGTYLSASLAAGSSRPTISALLDAKSSGNAKIVGLLGGQGNNKAYFDELRSVWETYRPFVGEFIDTLSETLKSLSQGLHADDADDIKEQYPRGLDASRWLRHAEDTPSNEYLVSAPVSFPLIGLLQLAHVKAISMSLGVSPSSLFSRLAGHSQGVVVAAILSTVPSSSNWEESYLAASLKAIKILFSIGCRSQQTFAQDALSTALATKLEVEYGMGKPTPMLSISGSGSLSRSQLDKIIMQTNTRLPSEKHVHLALINSLVNNNFVVSGPERTLAALVQNIRAISAPAADAGSQGRVPFSQRKPTPSMRFLPISVPCHCALLNAAVPLIEADLQNLGVSIGADELKVTVNQLTSAQLEEQTNKKDIVPLLVRLITIQPVNWVSENIDCFEIDNNKVTHIIDFGPGLNSGVGSLTHKNLLGRGLRVLIAGKLSTVSADPQSPGPLAELFQPAQTSLVQPPKWTSFLPSLIRTFATQDKAILNTPFSRLLRGLPPIMVGGMTPTTTSPTFVAAVMNAGYHIELACGGYHSAASLKTALTQLHSLIAPGRSIALNVIYVAPRQIAWQIPLIKTLRSEGMPISSVTVGGGVPSVEVATNWIDDLGLEFLSLKPGSVSGIRQVIDIAKARPNFSVVLQWTGGRGGGHHSAQDMFAPVLETYAEIRAHKNIVLLAGGGLGSAKDVTPWFTGEWVGQVSGRKNVVMMPFDGVLLGSRVMVTLEAQTSLGAKQQIAAAKGVENDLWEGTYKGETGGILSVVSEMGERIHVVATRGAKFWAEMDRIVFSVDKKKRAPILEKKRAMIIKGLNADFQRVWFGRKMDGSGREDCEVADMTYAEVVQRLVQLMAVAEGRRWIDKSYVGFLTAFLERVEERLGDEDCEESVVSEDDCRHDPILAVETVLRACPLAKSTLLCSEDVDFFFQLCRRAGQKPVPFVPALDDSFETWLKKDSLWQSEHVEAVVDQDAGRTFILHGPVAARHTWQVNEPVGEVLDGINQGVVEHLMQGLDASSLSYEEIIGMAKKSEALTESLDLSGLSGDDLRQALTGASTWKSALLGSRSILRGRDMVPNPVRRLFDTASFESSIGHVHEDSITIFGQDKRLMLEITKDANSVIEVLPFTYTTRGNKPVSLQLKFQYRPDTPYAPIREVMEHRNERICAMYRQLWQGETESQSTSETTETAAKGPEFAVFEDSFTVDSARVRTLNRAIGYSKAHQHEKVPMDFAVVACWSPICKALLQDPIQGDVLNLVHLSNAYEAAGQDVKPLQVGDKLSTRAFVNSIAIEDSGKVVEVVCEVRRQSQSQVIIMAVRSNFLFRGQYTDYGSTFARKTEPKYELHVSSEADIAVLATKPWFRLDNQNGNTLDNLNLTDLTLEFHLETSTKWLSKSVYSTIDTTGHAYVRSEAGDLTPVATILHRDFECKSNSVLSYLSRWGQIVASEKAQPLSTDAAATTVTPNETLLPIQIPSSNESYSLASGDFNPIHTSPLFASLVSLPGTITHGMYLSAAVRSLLETHLTNSTPSRIRSYNVSFTGMVLPNDSLTVSFSHTAMKSGNLYISISVLNPSTNAKVLTGSAILSQPSTTVIFTGQGSQEPGMGMSLYATSPIARGIWDRAETYFQSQFGLSILQIVRQNPKSITVHFGGVKGRMLRQNYLSMYYEVPGTGSSPVRKPIFPDITPTTKSYTHSSPNGLLFATQFAQPALTIMEMAAYKDLQSRGVLPSDCNFAGHSLGEYAALLSITDFMPFENLLYFVFWRGMTMQSAVERDEEGRSRFAMVAVDPSRITKGYREHDLRGLVKKVMDLSGWFVEIVNLNIKDRQYVCAGDLRSLDLLQQVCDSLAAAANGGKEEEELIAKLLVERYSDPNMKAEEIVLVRGKATVPLSGVDVPFHSSFLRPRIEAFRRTLQDSINMERLKPERLVGKYVPNVTGTPFELSREYLEKVAAITGSEKLQTDVLGRWEDWKARIQREGGRQEVGVAA
ncbi:fatty acid synthase [Rhypophila sp. PSN 637]